MKKLEEYKIMPIFPAQPVSGPQMSPDGTRILFTYSTVNMDEDKYDSHIWVFDLKEKAPRQFTHGKSSDTNARWSPDGRSILFLSNRASEEEKAADEKKRKAQVWIIPADGGESRRVTSGEEGVQRPVWSPDGRSILFLSSVFKGEKSKDSDVKIIRRLKYKYNGRGFFEGKWTHLFSVPASGGKAKQLTQGEFDVEAVEWSPDGKRVAFISNLDDDADTSFFKNIYVLPSKGGKAELLWRGKGPVAALGWSPDGEYLAFTGRVIEDPSLVYYKNTTVWLLPLKGGEPKNLTAKLDRTVSGEEGGLEWSPDSKHVYFKADDHGSLHVYHVSLDGKVEKITDGKMTVGSFSFDKSGQTMAFNSTDSVTPSELWVKNKTGMRRLTQMSKQLLKKLRISEPEEFWFTASDGIKVQGWIVKPQGIKKGEKYPMVLQIHGGPHSAYGFKLMPPEHEFQVLADHGFVVVYTNPRASTGYGEEFTRITGHWGERDYQDLMEAVDYVAKTYPYVDVERLGVAGGSYGGFMTNWVVGHTDRFKAAVSMRSISNWYSFHGTSDIGWMSLPTHELSWGKDPWDNLQVIMEKSPITYIKNIKTPLLLLQSEEDYRCPIEQAEQLFIGLKKLKRTVEFVRTPGESHELSRSGKPKHRVERLQHIVRWFDTYLREQ